MTSWHDWRRRTLGRRMFCYVMLVDNAQLWHWQHILWYYVNKEVVRNYCKYCHQKATNDRNFTTRMRIILRPHDVRRQAFIFYLWTIFLPADLRDGPAAPRQKYINGWVLGVARKFHSDILPTPPLIFTGSKNAKFGLILNSARV